MIVRLVTGCHGCSYDRSQNATIARTIGRRMQRSIDRTIGLRVTRLIVRSVTGCHGCSYDRSQDTTIARTIGRRMQRSIDRTIGRRPSRLIVHRSLNATTIRAISYDGSCRRYSPIVRDSAITRRDRSRYATAAGDRIIIANIADRSHLGPIVRSSNRTIQCDCGLRQCLLSPLGGRIGPRLFAI